MSEYIIDILGTAALRKCSELQLKIKDLEARNAELELRIKQADKIIKDRQDELNYLVNKVEKLENKLKIAINED
jgi:uncharacterized coiled-coil protein SlyX